MPNACQTHSMHIKFYLFVGPVRIQQSIVYLPCIAVIEALSDDVLIIIMSNYVIQNCMGVWYV